MKNELIEMENELTSLLAANECLCLAWGCTYNEAAEDLIANGVTIQRWIPVEERLPERDCRVAVLYRFPRSDMKFSTVFDYYASDPAPHFQHTMGEGGPIVTHWMPLPEAPKENE